LALAFRLERDLDLGTALPAGLPPIGDAMTPFTGDFDGGGHELRGLRIRDEDVMDGGDGGRGFFGYVAAPATIYDLGLRDVTLPTVARRRVGALVGLAETGVRIDRVYVRGTPLAFVRDSLWRIGGLIGENAGELHDCYSTVDMQVMASVADENDRTSVGGVVGANRGTVGRCYYSGRLETNAARGGGVVGRNRVFIDGAFVGGTVVDSFATIGSTGGGVEGTSAQCHHIGPVLGGGVTSTHAELYYPATLSCRNTDPACPTCDYAEDQTAIDLIDDPQYFTHRAPVDTWDLANVWTIEPGATVPTFRWEAAAP
jgi:hypothetical protein